MKEEQKMGKQYRKGHMTHPHSYVEVEFPSLLHISFVMLYSFITIAPIEHVSIAEAGILGMFSH